MSDDDTTSAPGLDGLLDGLDGLDGETLDLATALLDDPPAGVWDDALSGALAGADAADLAQLADLLPSDLVDPVDPTAAGDAGDGADVLDVLHVDAEEPPADAGDAVPAAPNAPDAPDAPDAPTDAAPWDDLLDAAEDLEAPAYEDAAGVDGYDEVLDTLDLDGGYDA